MRKVKVRIFLEFLRMSFILDESKFHGKIQCRADQNPEELKRYWSKISKIPVEQFSKPGIDKRTLGKPTKRPGYNGVFVIDYYSNSVFLELKFISDIIHKRIITGPVVYR